MEKNRNKVIITFVIFLIGTLVIAVIIYIDFKVKQNIEFQCDANDTAMDCFYVDGEYEYCYPTWGRYIIYKKEKIPFKEALERKLITLNDIDEIAREKPGCKYDKHALTRQ